MGKAQNGDGSTVQANPLRSDGPGGAMIRRVLPAAVAALVILGALRWLGQQVGLYGTAIGISLMTVASVGIVACLLWFFARWLNRNDAARRASEGDLKASARYFDLSSDMLCTAGFDGVFRKLNATWTETLGWS
ncbi:MAG: hypothetical protein H0V15_04755, partial [Solirubrobacterales bacterium]|nr:hypothetical protein [Solirubrobacterales bacterium]